MEPYELTLAGAAEKIKAKELSPVELTASVLARIDAVEDKITAFATLTPDLATKAAERAEAEIAAGNYRGPLHGIPVGIKDLYETAGVATTSSSKVRADYIPTLDSAVVEKLFAAGSVMVGKTHTHEFAFGAVTPTTRNPWDLDRMPGGSSGGSGAAVAAGECFLGMGSDTGGSIRIPASVCGTVGLKPTY
ncbi:MAG: aspartyl-tRNA(Asn)/glutamyl-tRNA(Gln) amidotransferase subunit, partial [Pseudonocardiales bacterium]|nr:aspartyl-tRNA(Asn)/glutamyl-tRNA(Gln) amidotransferase subunit [Pseudonocardiales bacterium]